MDKIIILIFFSISGLIVVSESALQIDLSRSRVFDTDLYKSVINSTECERQITYLKTRNIFLFGRFIDSGVRFPRGFLMLTISDLGNYEQCLGINEEVEDMRIQGKYALFALPFNQTLQLPFLNQPNVKNKKMEQLINILRNSEPSNNPMDSFDISELLALAHLEFAACMPMSCSLDDWITNVLFDIGAFGIEYDEMFYRIPNDKPWVAADYVAVVIFPLLGLITILSTLYDINHIIIKKRDPKKANIFYRTFSVYTNTRRLLTFTPNANAVDCLDGIRCISMMWVILGHSFQMYRFYANLTDALLWVTSWKGIFITTGLFSVDTFFMIAGLLLVYTTVGKMSGYQLLKKLHVFYLNRLLRLFPLLAALVLLQASVLHRVSDGPYWKLVAENTESCRTFWWSTLLHVQNFVNPDNLCINHSWYVAIDIQLHFISPVVLYWVLGKNKKAAWAALIIALLAILTGSTVFNFIKEFPSTSATIARRNEHIYYLNSYYMNTLCRAPVFFIGMITGYIINMYKGKELKLNMFFVIGSWTVALSLIAFCFYASYEIMQLDWDNQVLDSLFNSFMRCIWAIGLSWIIFACVKGYGGPINWLLSLDMWKLPARISYAMYLYHFPIMFVFVGSQLQPIYFSAGGRMYDFMAFLLLTFVLSFFVTVVIDAPFSVLIKMLMEGGQRRPRGENGSHKPGLIENKNISELQKDIITTLQKDQSIIGKRDSIEGNYSEKNEKH